MKRRIRRYHSKRKSGSLNLGKLMISDKTLDLIIEGNKGEDYKCKELCPNCARQGQIFPNSSKRNQKLVEKLE